MDLEATKARLTEIEAEEARLNAERAPIDAGIRRLRSAVDAQMVLQRPFDERLRELYDERRSLENHLVWLGQSGKIGESWRAYLAGERETIVVAAPRDIADRRREVRPVRVVGDWAVHRSLRDADDDDRDSWSVTHGPSGMRALTVDSEVSALGLAVQLRDVTADPAPGADNSAAGAIVARHHKAMR